MRDGSGREGKRERKGVDEKGRARNERMRESKGEKGRERERE